MSKSLNKSNRKFFKDFFELLGSMRFAVSLLVFIAIVSIIGTVLEQDLTEIEYIDQFGTFWYAVFDKFQVGAIYNTWWFLTIMGFLVVSTTLCVIRHTPSMLREMRSFKEYTRQNSLRAFPHHINLESDKTPEESLRLGRLWLKKNGYSVKENTQGEAQLLAAKKGSSNRLGYIFAHVAIVVICIGGLLDSELLNRLQVWFAKKPAIPEQAQYVSEVPKGSWFSENNPSFRGNLVVSEDEAADYAMLNFGDKGYMQSLPFKVKLNKFIIEYYETNGMPKRFASDVEITDKVTGDVLHKVIEVNKPVTLHGITLYQSSFDDGGSELSLKGYPVKGTSTQSFDVEAKVGSRHELSIQENNKTKHYQIQIEEFSPINVEDLSQPGETQLTLQEQLIMVTGSAADKKRTNLHNVGPSFTYSLIDDKNQAVKFRNYMLPIALDNDYDNLVYLLGVQRPEDFNFSYARIPADEKGSKDEFLALRSAMNSSSLRRQAAMNYAEKDTNNLANQQLDQRTTANLVNSALKAFAEGGYPGIDRFVEGVDVAPEQRMPEQLREPMKGILRDYVVFGIMELRTLVRENLGLKALSFDEQIKTEKDLKWLEMSVRAISDLSFYPSHITFDLKTFKHRQATVLQTTRSPGKFIVYLGSVFLMIGVFAMFYIQDRRIWFWVNKTETGGSTIKAAMTSRKRNLDFNREFNRFQNDFKELAINKESSS